MEWHVCLYLLPILPLDCFLSFLSDMLEFFLSLQSRSNQNFQWLLHHICLLIVAAYMYLMMNCGSVSSHSCLAYSRTLPWKSCLLFYIVPCLLSTGPSPVISPLYNEKQKCFLFACFLCQLPHNPCIPLWYSLRKHCMCLLFPGFRFPFLVPDSVCPWYCPRTLLVQLLMTFT